MKRLLVVQLGEIGDLILTTPALAALREAQPTLHIAVLTAAHAAPVLTGTGLADEIITLDRQHLNNSRAFYGSANLKRLWALRAGGYDTVLYCHHFTLALGTLKFALIGYATGATRRVGLENGRGWFLTERLPDGGFGAEHQAQYWLNLAALLGANPQARPAVVAKEPHPLPLSPWREAGGEVVVIHPGSGGYSPARRWEAAKFAAVADALAEGGAQIVLVGGAKDGTDAVQAAMRHTALDLSGKTTLPELAGVLADASVFIGADSGVMHLAAAAGVPVIAIFGPSNHLAWRPWTPNPSLNLPASGEGIHVPSVPTPPLLAGEVGWGYPSSQVIRSAAACSPCFYVGDGIGQRDGCPARTCLKMVTPQQVVAAARVYLTSPPTSFSLTPQTAGEGLAVRFGRAVVRPYDIGKITLLGLPIHGITFTQWLDWIGAHIRAESPAQQVCTVNPEFMMIAQKDALFRVILQRAALCVPDGVGLLWAARRRGTPLPERVTGSDGVPLIAERAAREGWRLYLLGAAEGVAEQAATVLRQRYPGLHIAGTFSGTPAPEAEDALVERINASAADILFVAYGAPTQDKWIARNLPRLRVHVAMGIGGALDFVAGIVPRAPKWMRRWGIEWLYRLYLQPSRLGRMMRLPRFVLAVLWEGWRR